MFRWLDGKPLTLEDLWINILPEGGIHTAHIHPHSVISGTTYVAMPEGASALKLEDPRHAMMMASPPRYRKDAPEELQQFVYVKPQVGDVLLWESWLRHEVPMNMAEDDRISVSFQLQMGRGMTRGAIFPLLLALSLPAAASEDCTEDAMIVFDGSGSMAEMGFNQIDEPRIFSARRAVGQGRCPRLQKCGIWDW